VTPSGPVAATKQALRTQVLAARRLRDAESRRRAAGLLSENVVALIAGLDVRCVSAYVSLDEEPGTGQLIESLHEAGTAVMLPVLLPDRELDWAYYRPGHFRRGRLGLLEPASSPLGIDAVREADVVVCPGLAGSASGDRLGRGGGSYDRALTRARPTTLRCLLLYDDEVVDAVPTDAHDQRVDAIVTPSRTLHMSAGRRDDEGVGG
jgi:5-formyltetrahydrofolate cyclo-ligase